MKVTLISTTQSHIIEEFTKQPLTAEELTVYIARVSNPSNQHNHDTGAKLLAYCIRNGHWSVFEHVHMTVEIETSIAIATQILRHRSFTFQQFSQRYADVSKLGDMIEPIELRMKAVGGNRQGSAEAVANAVQDQFDYSTSLRAHEYATLITLDVAPESARFVLPQCTKTRLYMTGNLRSWIHYLAQRTDSHAQKEHRDVANAILEIFEEQFPATYEACSTIEIPAHTLFTK